MPTLGIPSNEPLITQVLVRISRQVAYQSLNTIGQTRVQRLYLLWRFRHVRSQEAQKRFDHRVILPPRRFCRRLCDDQHPAGRNHMGAHLAGELRMSPEERLVEA
jgi:hypothetical protein